MTRQALSKPSAWRRLLAWTTTIGAVLIMSLAVAVPAQAITRGGGSVYCPNEEARTWSTMTAGTWTHTQRFGTRSYNRSGVNTTPSTVRVSFGLDRISEWQVSAREFTAAGIACV
jgi:hypothetical protein